MQCNAIQYSGGGHTKRLNSSRVEKAKLTCRDSYSGSGHATTITGRWDIRIAQVQCCLFQQWLYPE